VTTEGTPALFDGRARLRRGLAQDVVEDGDLDCTALRYEVIAPRLTAVPPGVRANLSAVHAFGDQDDRHIARS
jgi:hypothetical protein